jgi:uncharacterized protein (TIGR02145 family)
MAIVAVLAIAFASCKKDNPIAVDEVTLNWATASLEPSDEITLEPTVTPANATNPALTWTSSDNAIATVADGVVTGVAPGKATITATSADGAVFDFCVITVVAVPEVQNLSEATPGWGATLGTVSFVSDNTWEIGGLTWSDVVVASACDKTTFNGGAAATGFLADCRSNKGRVEPMPWEDFEAFDFDYGHLFSMAAVVRFRKELCPEGWRVPRQEDFVALVQALGGTNALQESDAVRDKLIGAESDWGGVFGGRWTGSSLTDQHVTAHYWSVTESAANNGRFLQVGRAMNADFNTVNNIVNPSAALGKGLGMTVRCVR